MSDPVLGSTALVTIKIYLDTSGKVSFSGSSPVIIRQDMNLGGTSFFQVFYSDYTPTGGVATGGEADVNFNIPIIKTFLWGNGSGIFRWFRVTGKCRPSAGADTNQQESPSSSSSPPSNGVCKKPCPRGSPSETCDVSFVVNVVARDVNEVCRKIKKMHLSGPIDKIEVFSIPAFPTSPVDDDECNTLTEVQTQFDEPNENTNPPGESIPETIAADCAGMFTDFQVLVCSGGQVFAGFVYADEPSGSLTVSNGAGTTSNEWDYTASGGLNISGSSNIFSPQYYPYSASGGIIIGSSNITSFLGTLLVEGVGTTDVLDLDVTFAFEPAPAAGPSADEIDTQCCPIGPTSVQVQVKHNLLNVPPLAQFLHTNKLTLPPIYSLTYSRRLNLWYNTLHFKGISQFNSQIEDWEIVTEFGCLTDVSNDPDSSWRFMLTIYKSNEDTREQGFIRFHTLFDPADVCKPDGNFKFTFEFVVPLNDTVPSHVDGLVFTDGMGAFKGTSFLRDPVLRFEVSVPVPALDAGVLNYTNYVVIPPEP